MPVGVDATVDIDCTVFPVKVITGHRGNPLF